MVVPGSIAEQEVDHHVDMLLGGGYSRFAETIDGRLYNAQTVLASAAAQGYQLVRRANDLQNTTPNIPRLGLFAPGNMNVEWGGALAEPFPGTGPQITISAR